MNAALTTPFEVPGAVEVETAATRRADHQRGRVIKAYKKLYDELEHAQERRDSIHVVDEMAAKLARLLKDYVAALTEVGEAKSNEDVAFWFGLLDRRLRDYEAREAVAANERAIYAADLKFYKEELGWRKKRLWHLFFELYTERSTHTQHARNLNKGGEGGEEVKVLNAQLQLVLEGYRGMLWNEIWAWPSAEVLAVFRKRPPSLSDPHFLWIQARYEVALDEIKRRRDQNEEDLLPQLDASDVELRLAEKVHEAERKVLELHRYSYSPAMAVVQHANATYMLAVEELARHMGRDQLVRALTNLADDPSSPLAPLRRAAYEKVLAEQDGPAAHRSTHSLGVRRSPRTGASMGLRAGRIYFG